MEKKLTSQASRKGKKAWRKNVDIGAVEQQLEELRNEERFGGKLHAQPDDAIFFTDKSGDADARKAIRNRKLRIDQILTPQSAFEGVRSRLVPPSAKTLPPAFTGGKPRAVSKSVLAQVERLAKRKRDAGLLPGSSRVEKKRRVEERKKELEARKGGFDLWDVKDNSEADASVTTEYIEPFKAKPVKKPKLPEEKPKAIPAVELTHAGASYNPTFDDHQDALRKAVDDELEKEKKRADLAKKLSYPAELDLLDDETFFEDDSEEEESEEEEEETADPSTTMSMSNGAATDTEREDNGDDAPRSHVKPVNVELRKTRAQRNKEARRAEKEREEKKAKEEKELLKQLNRLGEIKKDVAKAEKESAARREQRLKAEAQAAAEQTKRLGPHFFKAAPMDVQLTEDLADSLRELKPEGNLFLDRFQSLQKRSLIETRVRVGKRQKYKRKMVETHDYKRFK
ncbi:Glioma tumor suppressor candidate region protein 2 [Borealophlyctis nickersoniae]|nr:Glioma tumor suppressor candidate region protein 2 [Borealophlyctis nickersoniae]